MKLSVALAVGITASAALLGGAAQSTPVLCSGRWCSPYYLAAGSNPTGVALADFDADRWTDIAVAVQGEDKLGILMNSGTGAQFDPVLDIPLSGGSAPHSVVAVDIDNDEDLDLVVTRAGMNDVQVLTNSGGVLSLGAMTGVGGTLPSDIAAGDIDGNGFVDIVTSNRGSSDVSVLFNTAGVLSSGVPYAVGSGPRGLALSDFDGGGSLDLAVASSDNGMVHIFLNDGSGILGLDSSLAVGTDLNPSGGVAAADLNGDQKVDVAVVTTGPAGDFATTFMNLGAGLFDAPEHFRSDENHPINDTGNPRALIAKDLDLDGFVDLTLTNLETNRMGNLLGDGTGFFNMPILVRVLEKPVGLAAADLDGNGSDDVVTANQDSEDVGVLINTFIFLADGFEWGDTWAWSDEVQ